VGYRISPINIRLQSFNLLLKVAISKLKGRKYALGRKKRRKMLIYLIARNFGIKRLKKMRKLRKNKGSQWSRWRHQLRSDMEEAPELCIELFL
jgi:hypothetical protein